MKKLLAAATFLAVSIPAALQAAPPKAEIRRVKGEATAPILVGVAVPPGTNIFYLSGQVPAVSDTTKDPKTLEAYGDTKTQAISVFNKIKTHLTAQGLGLGDVVKLTVYLVGDPKTGGKLDFKGFSEAYAQFFGTTEQPNIVARTTVQVAALANPAYLVEIEATAAKGGK